MHMLITNQVPLYKTCHRNLDKFVYANKFSNCRATWVFKLMTAVLCPGMFAVTWYIEAFDC